MAEWLYSAFVRTEPFYGTFTVQWNRVESASWLTNKLSNDNKFNHKESLMIKPRITWKEMSRVWRQTF